MNNYCSQNENTLIQLQKQIEYYFSKENLQTDTFLLNHMDDNYYVSIDIIQTFKRIRLLTTSIQDIICAIQKSTLLVLNEDNTKVKPNIYIPKTTLIIRNMPDICTINDIYSLFTDPKVVLSVQQEIANIWLVTLINEEITKQYNQAFQNYIYHGNTLKVRIKTENLIKYFNKDINNFKSVDSREDIDAQYSSIYSLNQSSRSSSSSSQLMHSSSETDLNSMISKHNNEIPIDHSYYPNTNSLSINSSRTSQETPLSSYYYYYKSGIDPTLYLPPYFHRSRGAKRKTTQAMSQQENLNINNSLCSTDIYQSNDVNTVSFMTERVNVPKEINSNSNTHSVNCECLCCPSSIEYGYHHSFIKYTSTEIYDIVSLIQDTSLPSSLQPGDHSDVLVEANQQLLERGRTVSFDEALTQGRPRVLSIDNNDYLSLIHQLDQIELEMESMHRNKNRKKPKRKSSINSKLINEKSNISSISTMNTLNNNNLNNNNLNNNISNCKRKNSDINSIPSNTSINSTKNINTKKNKGKSKSKL